MPSRYTGATIVSLLAELPPESRLENCDADGAVGPSPGLESLTTEDAVAAGAFGALKRAARNVLASLAWSDGAAGGGGLGATTTRGPASPDGGGGGASGSVKR